MVKIRDELLSKYLFPASSPHDPKKKKCFMIFNVLFLTFKKKIKNIATKLHLHNY